MRARMVGTGRRAGWAVVLAAALLAAGGGCVAVDVGKPEVHTRTDVVAETAAKPVRGAVLEVRPKFGQVQGTRLDVQLEARVREVFPQTKHEERVTVKKQRRLAFGFFPAGAQYFMHPKDGLLPARQRSAIHEEGETGDMFMKDYAPAATKRVCDQRGPSGYDDYRNAYNDGTNRVGYGAAPFTGGDYVAGELERLVKSVCLLGLAGMGQTLLVEPFSGRGWTDMQEFVDGSNGRWVEGFRKNVFDASGSPKAMAFGRFPSEEREKMGVVTCQDVYLRQEPVQRCEDIGYSGIFGFYKYLDVIVEGPERTGGDVSGTETKERKTPVEGPYEVELRIPSMGIATNMRVEKGRDTASFVLPQTGEGGAREAMLRYRAVVPGGNWVTDRAMEKIAGKVLNTTVRVPGRQGVPVVAEVHHYHETRVVEERKAEGAPYTVEKTADGTTGRTVWRVRMREDQTAFGVDSQIKASILQELRDDFAGRNPEVPRGEINAFATYTTEDGGRTLVYVGVAESLIPSLESLEYSEGTHRGMVRMRLRAGADLRRSKEFVRQHISAIVCDKNVLMTAGERPPDGATYRSLDENFADGVLTVEFEAVE